MIASTPRAARLPAAIPVVQCAMNVSEGRREWVLARIADAAADLPNVVVADVSADPDHHRAVLSLLGHPETLVTAVLHMAGRAVELIDLRDHAGVHPRTGVVDVVPFTPVRGTDMAQCRRMALACAEMLSCELGIAVYLYGEAARPGRPSELPALRQLLGARGSGAADWNALVPDYGRRVDPSRGAAMVGARPPLVAYNVNLERGDIHVARAIAAEIRAARDTTPGLVGVRALGLYLASRDVSQVSMNVTRPDATSLPAIYAFVRNAAQARGAVAGRGEVVGLVPLHSLGGCEAGSAGLEGLKQTQILEYWLDGPWNAGPVPHRVQ